MARQLLLKSLVSIFGDFVDGLTEENLKVGVWSGEILLENLRLNQEGIKRLNLPVDVQHGYIGSFRVFIPWSRLTSESVTVEIENVVLVASPGDPRQWDPEELRKKNLDAKRVLLEKATEAARAWSKSRSKTPEKKAESAGYFGRLATRIADNLFVFLKNIHIRFEDPISDPEGSLSAGIIVQDFQVQSTNEKFEATFVSRDDKKAAAAGGAKPGAIYKKILMRGFAVYWNTRSHVELGKLPLNQLLTEMARYEEITASSSTSNRTGEQMAYVVSPVTLEVKLTHNEGSADPATPVFAVDVELPLLQLALQTEQYAQAMAIKTTFDRLNRMSLLLPYRPKKPVKEDPRAWWRYAYFCVKRATKSLDVAEIIGMFRKRRRYIHLFEKALSAQQAEAQAAALAKQAKSSKSPAAGAEAAALVAANPPLSAEEQAAFDMMEETVPLDTLVVWRTVAHTAMRRQAKLRKRKSRSIAAAPSTLDASDAASDASGDTLATAKSSMSEVAAARPQKEQVQGQGVGGWFSSWWGKPAEQGKGNKAATGGGGAGKGAGAGSDSSDEEGEEGDWQDVVDKGEDEEEVEEGDVSLDDLITQAGAALAAQQPPTPPTATAALFRVRLRTTSVVTVYAAKRAPLLELSSALALEAAQTGETLTASIRLPEFRLKDLYTPTALFTHIAKAGDGGKAGEAKEGGGTSTTEADIFFLGLETSPRATSVRIRTRPLDLVYSKGWLARVLALRPPPELREALAQRAVQNLNAATAVAASALGQSTLRADVEIAAPRIFVPLAESEDQGFLLLDTGHLSFRGGTLEEDPAASAWDLKLSQIQSQLHMRKGNWLLGRLAQWGGGQLIEPFEIDVGLQMRGGGGDVSTGGDRGSPGKEADMSVTTALSPGIRGIFTPQLLRTTLAIVTNLGLPPLEEEEAGPMEDARQAIGESALQLHRQVTAEGPALPMLAPSQPSRRSSAIDASAASARSRPSAAAAAEEEEADPLHVKMEVRVEIPTVALELREDQQSSQSAPTLHRGDGRLFLVAMDGFRMDYAARAYDSSIDLVLGALSIENLAGQAQQQGGGSGGNQRRFLAQSSSSSGANTQEEEQQEQEQQAGLVHFRMVSHEDRSKAPGYDKDKHDRVILLEFATLALKCDPDSLRLLAPFYGALMCFEEERPQAPSPAALLPPGATGGLRRTMSVASNASTTTTLAAAAAELSARAAAAAALAAAQEGGKTMQVTARLARVSMELLAGGVVRRPVIMAEIAGLGADLEMGEAMDVRVVLRTFEVTDTQPESRDNAIRKLICPKQGLAEGSGPDMAATLPAGKADAAVAAPEAGGPSKPLLVARVKEDKADAAYDIDLTLEDFTLNVLVEALLAAVDVSLENVNAVLAVLAAGAPPPQQEQQSSLPALAATDPTLLPPADAAAANARMAGLSLAPAVGEPRSPARMGRIGEGDEERSDVDEDGEEEEGDHTRLSASQLQGVAAKDGEQPPMGLRVKVKLLNPGLILIENARNYDSRAVSMRGTFNVLYVSKAEGTAGTESLHVDAQGLEAFVDVVGGSAVGPVQIVTPFALGAHQKRQSEKGKLLVSEVLLNLDRVLTRVAYHDVMLVQGILSGLADAMARFQATTAAAAAAAAEAVAGASALQGVEQGMVPGWTPEGGGEEFCPVTRPSGGEEDEDENDSEVGLPLSAADEELMRFKSTALSKLSVSLAGVEVLFINDYEGLEQPLLEFGLEDGHFSLEQCADAYQGDGGLRLRARFFNPSVLFWEPVLEPWALRCDVSTEAAGVVVAVATDRVLYLDLTEAFLQTLSRTYSLFLSATDTSSSTSNTSSLPATASLRSLSSGDSASLLVGGGGGGGAGMTSSPYIITNRTGLELVVDGGGGQVLVPPNATMPLELMKEGRPVRGMTDSMGDAGANGRRDVASGGGGGFVTVAFTGVVGEQRRPLSKLRADVPGTFLYALKPVQEAGGKVYPAPVLEETWENERSDRLTAHWRTPFLPTDRPCWSDEQGKRERKREDIPLPGPGWRWLDEWHVDMCYGRVGTEIDEEGWTYGVEFPGFSLNRIKRTYRDMDGVRRRRWIRTRIPVPPPIDDPTRPLAVAWRVELLPDGRTELAVESKVTLVNETDVGLEVRAFIDPSAAAEDKEGHRLDPVPPNGSVCLPILLAYASTVRVRPLLPAPAAVGGGEEDEPTSSSSLYGWSPPFLISRGAGASEEVVVAQPFKTSAAACCPVALVVDATVTSGGLASIFLRPPFVVENLLPCHLLVSIAPHGPGTAHVKAIPPGVSAGIVSRPPRTSQDVRVKLLDYGWSQDQELGGAPQRLQNLKAFCCQHPMTGEELWLTGWARRPPKGPASRMRLQLQVYVRNWVVDRTGLGLGFAEDARPVSRASRVRTRTAPTASYVAGGIRPLSLRGSIGTSSCGAVEVLDLEVDEGRSTRPYRVAAVDNGSPIYTDRPCVFTGLPPRLRRKPAVLAPNDDKALAGERLLSFRVSEGADVFLLYDVSGGANQPPLPAWIAQAGFARAEDLPLVTVNTQRHEEGVIKFQAFHKHVPASAPWVALGGNGSTRNNYVVIVAKEALPASSASETASTVLVPSAAEWGHWEEEAALGLLLYDPRNHKQPRMCVCVGEEVAWSKPLDVEHVVDRGVFEVNTEQACYEMSLSVSVCPGVFYRTKQVTVAPRFVVVNCMDAEVALRQTDMDDRVVRLQPHQRTPFHFAPRQANKKREVQLMLPGQTGWSYGGVGLENVGGTAVLLPHDERDPERHAPVVVHVEVKLAESEEECAVVIALWRPQPPEPPLYAVHNYTPFTVQFVQMDVRAAKPRWTLTPGRTSVYGWEFPTMRHVLFLRVFNPALPERKLCCEVYLDKVLDGDVIDMGRGHGKIYLKVLAEDGTKVLKIVTARSMLLPPRQPSQRELTVRLSLPGVGLSLVGADEEEGRREIGFLFIQDVRAEYLQGTREREVELKVKSVQLDNHVRNAIFPVILCPRTLKTDGQDFIHLALLAETDTTPSGAGTHTTIRYLALRVLAMDVQLDLRSLLRYLHFFQQVALLDYDRATAELHPARFVGGLRDFYGYAEPLPWVDVAETCRAVTNARVYFERIDLHPFAVALSFVQTVADKRVGFGGNVLEILRNLATISRAPVQLRSFQVEHAMETPASFSHIVLAHYKRQAFAQVLTIAGSLSTLGSPVDLVTSVGTGVKDFFYEPINGLVHSPKEFAKGLKKGTTSLLKGVVSGALNSVAGVGDTLNRNVAMLAADREYAQEREQRRQAATAGGTGIVDGLKGGGESLVRGFADGIGGVFTAPVKEARTGGIGGFIKGVGKGVVGLAVKPLVGVSDAVVSVIQGASQAAQDLEVHNPVRPRRALPRLSRTGEKVLTDYSLQASQVQERVDQGDAYVCHVSLKDKDVIFTDQYLTIANHAKGTEWKRAWRDIAWCELSDYGGVMIHLYRNDDSGGNNRGTLLAVQDADEAYYIYELLLQHAHKMGNGAQMPPLEQALLGQEAGIGDDAAGVGAGGLLGGYRWGSKNDQDLRCRRLRSWDIVARARERLTKMWDTWPELDDCVWRVINDWTKNHRGPLNFRKCLALLIINKGSTGVQIQGTDFRDGSEIHIIETQRYDKAGRVIRPQDGAVLVLAWSHIPTLVKKAHIAFRIETTAFKGEVTDKGATVQAKPGWEAGFLEKTRKSDYVKYVVVVG